MSEKPDKPIDRPSDPLSDLIQLVQPRQLNWKTGEQAGPWRLTYPANDGISFTLVVSGAVRVRLEGEEARRLEAGDFLLLLKPPDWSLEHEDVADAAGVVGGHFRLDPANAMLLTRLLPPRVNIKALDPASGRLRALVGLIGDESTSGRPGRSLVLERLIEVLFIEALRRDEDGAEADERPGLLAGLNDRRIGSALRALHANVAQGWTVATLAEAAGMSRSAFADRFSRLTGLPPLTYVLQWRMALAKRDLNTGGASLADIAVACGYGSVSAFSTAFTRVVGRSPSAYAKGKPHATDAIPA